MESNSFIKAETAFMSLRVWPGQWLKDDRFAGLLSMLGRHRGVADEIAFQNACTLSPVPFTAIHESANVLRDRIKRSKAAGYRAGINVVATLGHNDEYASDALQGDFTRMTDVDGTRSPAIFCSNDVAFREYVAELYRAMAEADPDFIWIDDVRTFARDIDELFDLVIFGDVIEHMTRTDAIYCVNRLCSSRALISIPIGECPQDPTEENPYEAHLATWETEEVLATFPVIDHYAYKFPPPHYGRGVFLLEKP